MPVYKRKTVHFSPVVVLLIVLAVYSNGVAQKRVIKDLDSAETYTTSLLSVGFGSNSSFLGMGLGLYFGFSPQFMVGIRGSARAEFDLDHLISQKVPIEEINDIGVVARFAPVRASRFSLWISAGVGTTQYIKRGKFLKRSFLNDEYENISGDELSLFGECEADYELGSLLGLFVSVHGLTGSKVNTAMVQAGIILFRKSR